MIDTRTKEALQAENKQLFMLMTDAERRIVELRAFNLGMHAAATLGLEAIDNILSAHEGQSEYAQLREAFDALQAAIAKAEGRS